MALILDGTIVSQKILQKIKAEIENMQPSPKLAIVYIGNDTASEIYIKNKLTRAKEIGIETQLIKLNPDAKIDLILKNINALNSDKAINGIIVQAPLPVQSMQHTVFNSILPSKDVDGFCDQNIAKLVRWQDDCLVPCTPKGICRLLEEYNITFAGKHVVIIGRSNIVGKPLSILLSQKSEKFNATVTLCHSETKDLKSITKSADIIIVAIGRKSFLSSDMVKEGAIVVDVGINREFVNNDTGNYIVSGDTDFEALKNICSAITPVPGGIGPMTVAMLMQNTLIATKMQNGLL